MGSINYRKFRFIIEIILIIAVNALPLYAQPDTRVTSEELKKTGTNYFNYSDPGKINIEITVLGGVKYPGIYLVPEGTKVIELISLSGNVLKEETADNIKLIRPSRNNGKSVNKLNPVLVHGDVLVIPMTPEKTFWDFFKDASLVITPLATLATLIISIIALSK